MSDERIDLLPPIYGARARLRMLNRRIAMICVFGATALLGGVLPPMNANIRRSSNAIQKQQERDTAEESSSRETRRLRDFTKSEESSSPLLCCCCCCC